MGNTALIKPAMKMQRITLFLTSILPVMAAFSGNGSNDLVAVTSINSCIRLDIRYATTNNFDDADWAAFPILDVPLESLP